MKNEVYCVRSRSRICRALSSHRLYDSWLCGMVLSIFIVFRLKQEKVEDGETGTPRAQTLLSIGPWISW